MSSRTGLHSMHFGHLTPHHASIVAIRGRAYCGKFLDYSRFPRIVLPHAPDDRQIMALFDEYQSNENAKHVLRALKENARQGFRKGSLPPIGYRVVAAEQRGAKIKKNLEIDSLHADTIRLIYRLVLEGDGRSGPMGVKNIAAHLNRHRIFAHCRNRHARGDLHDRAKR